MDVRKRPYGKSFAGKLQARVSPGEVPPMAPATDVSLTGLQRTESEGHPFKLIKAKTGEDIGGDFLTQKVFFKTPVRWYTLRDSSFEFSRYYHGPLLATEPGHPISKGPAMSQSELDAIAPKTSAIDLARLGTTAVARTIPTNPVFSAAAFLGELREGLPSIPGRSLVKTVSSKDAAGEYLNYQFGILPLLSDAKKFLKSRETAERRLIQLYRDSGRVVRRRYTFPDEKKVETFLGRDFPFTFPGNSAYLISQGDRTLTKTTTTKTWFSGAYSYLFPRQEGFAGRLAELDKTYGVIPDVEDLYQLTPWSWAVDWVSNLGDLIANMKAFSEDSLVLRYGYIMRHTVVEYDYRWVGNLTIGGAYVPSVISTSIVAEVKQRQRATPYGFGLDFSGFTATQQAIIAALGISRGGRR